MNNARKAEISPGDRVFSRRCPERKGVYSGVQERGMHFIILDSPDCNFDGEAIDEITGFPLAYVWWTRDMIKELP